ncbi:MAG TPA: hypothetical protein VGH20_06065 [Myxococcales bacterium]
MDELGDGVLGVFVITPRLLRKSLVRAGQWRLLFVFWAAVFLPSVLVALPVLAFFEKHLGHSPAALFTRMDSATALDLFRQLSEDGSDANIRQGVVAALLVLLVSAPFAAAAAVAAAQTDERLRFRALLAGAGGLYGRMVRTFVAALIPFAIAAALTSAAFFAANRANDKAIRETLALGRWALASAAAAVLIFLAHLVVDAARAQFAAAPQRRSALFALGKSLRLFVRRPLRVLGIGLVGGLCAAVPSALLMLARVRLPQRNPALVALAWLLAQLAIVCVGWGRNVRIFALAELSRADAAERLRVPAVQAPVGDAALSAGQRPAI